MNKRSRQIDMNGYRVDPYCLMGFGAIDEHGDPVARTKATHPYNYDGYVLHRFGANKEANDTIYSDRLMQWDFDKHDRLLMQVFGDKRQAWTQRDPKKIEEFLRLWCEDPELKLILVMEYCNQSSGYPCWRFDYYSKPKPTEEGL